MGHPLWNDDIAPAAAGIERQKIPSIPRKIDPDPLQFVITSMLVAISKSNPVRALNFIRRNSDALTDSLDVIAMR
jgi:hypothetical protein